MKIIVIVSLAALSFTACDSKQEEARKAEVESHADKLDAAADATKKAAASDADVTKKEGEAKAEALKNEADRVRDQK